MTVTKVDYCDLTDLDAKMCACPTHLNKKLLDETVRYLGAMRHKYADFGKDPVVKARYAGHRCWVCKGDVKLGRKIVHDGFGWIHLLCR